MWIREWCCTIVELPRGRVLLRNLVYDLEERRIPQTLYRSLIDHVGERFHAELSAESAVDLVDGFRNAASPERTCRGQGGPDAPESCSRVIDEASCFFYNFRPEHYGVPAEDEPPAWFFREVARRPLESAGVRGDMNTGRGYVWVTPREHLEALGEPAADRARSSLGLDHLRSGMRLLALHYPEGQPWGVQHGPPTAIEGGANAVFRSTAADDGWGRAVDLATLEDGLPELTHEPIPFTDAFELEVLGPVRHAERPSPETLADATAPMSDEWLEHAIVKLIEHAGSAVDDRSR
ncbi:MAG: hypothetical protein AAGM22_07050 [Acidobacteriota bacterium]